MASLFRRPTGGAAIQFSGLDGRRRTLGLGDVSDRVASKALDAVERLLEAARYAQPAPADVTAWLESLPEATYARFIAAELVAPREKPRSSRVTVAEHAKAYLDRRTDIKPASRLVLAHAVRNLVDYFGETALADVTSADADDFSRWLATDARVRGESSRKPKGLSPATLGKRLSWAATIWRDAVRRELVNRNPFDDVKKPGGVNPDRQRYVPAETIETLIAAEPDLEWRALLALARYLGVRTPSEPFSMTWDCIDWQRKRIRIPSPKTEVHNKSYRMAPILPEVLPHLEALYAATPEGTLFVFSRLRERESRRRAEKGFWSALNLRTALQKKLAKAGIAPWPKLWHALRASAETDLARRFSLASVTAWLGNSPKVAATNYLMVTDEDFDRAASEIALQSALQSGPELQRNEQRRDPGNEKTPGKPRVLSNSVAGAGFEPTTSRL
jgi:integrase